MAAYKQGNGITLIGSFIKLDGTVVDPTVVSCVVKLPSGTLQTYVYGTDSNLTRTAPGRYECYIVPNVRGKWRYKFTGSGNVDAVDDKDFDIIPTAF